MFGLFFVSFYKGFEHLEDMITALKRKNISGILIDRCTTNYHLFVNPNDSAGLTLIKHFPGYSYDVGMVIVNQQLDKCLTEAVHAKNLKYFKNLMPEEPALDEVDIN